MGTLIKKMVWGSGGKGQNEPRRVQSKGGKTTLLRKSSREGGTNLFLYERRQTLKTTNGITGGFATQAVNMTTSLHPGKKGAIFPS